MMVLSCGVITVELIFTKRLKELRTGITSVESPLIFTVIEQLRLTSVKHH
jgi:hypothetical protein